MSAPSEPIQVSFGPYQPAVSLESVERHAAQRNAEGKLRKS
jgi:hypothetical protein